MIFTMDEVRRLQKLRNFHTFSAAKLEASIDPLELIRDEMVSRLQRAFPLAANIVARDVVIRPTEWDVKGQARFEAFWEPKEDPAPVVLLGHRDGEVWQARDLYGVIVHVGSGVRGAGGAIAYSPLGWDNTAGHWVMAPGRLS